MGGNERTNGRMDERNLTDHWPKVITITRRGRRRGAKKTKNYIALQDQQCDYQ